MPLRAGYEMAGKMDEPIFTPSTKVTKMMMKTSRSIRCMKLSAKTSARNSLISVLIYISQPLILLRERIIIADTKIEFGMIDGELVLIDEVLTPDSSRFWPADSYAPGSSPLSYDKQFVRDYLETLDWDKRLPALKYRQIF